MEKVIQTESANPLTHLVESQIQNMTLPRRPAFTLTRASRNSGKILQSHDVAGVADLSLRWSWPIEWNYLVDGMMSFFDYFQIASVALFLLTIVGKTAYLRKVRNINPIVIGGGKKGVLLAVELIGFSCLVVWMVEVLLQALHSGFRIFPSPLDMQLIDSLTAKLAGVSLVTLGLLIFNLAYVSFGDSWRVGFDVKTPGKLVTRGIFTVSRNPIYLSLNLWFFGIFLINGTLIFLLFAMLAIAVQHWQILQEEDFLSRLYGQPYQDYRARTPRYVIW